MMMQKNHNLYASKNAIDHKCMIIDGAGISPYKPAFFAINIQCSHSKTIKHSLSVKISCRAVKVDN